MYSFELHLQVNAIQMSTHNICFSKEVDKKYTGCNLKTTALLDCVLVGICVVIRLNMVYSKLALGNQGSGCYRKVVVVDIFFYFFHKKHMLWVLTDH